MPPTVFSNVRDDMRIAQEEIFGPVISAIPFTDIDRPRLRLCMEALLATRETIMKQLAALHGELLRVTKNDHQFADPLGEA